jgi:hypothetical protein
LPAPESYESARLGARPRAGVAGKGMEKEAEPVTGLAEKASPIPLMAPPPLGRLRAGALVRNPSASRPPGPGPGADSEPRRGQTVIVLWNSDLRVRLSLRLTRSLSLARDRLGLGLGWDHRQSGFGQEPGSAEGGGRKPASPNGPKMV